MSESTLKLHGKRALPQLVSSSFNALFQDTRQHDVWWQANTLADKINTRYQLSGAMKIQKPELLRVVGKDPT
jgi:hypothetical protein